MIEFTMGEMYPASDESVKQIIESPTDGDGRSEWFWVWTSDGDVMLACFPQGDMYFATEEAREQDWEAASRPVTT
jgi:hypothetical protein